MLNPMSTTLKNHPQPLINVTDYPDPNATQKSCPKICFFDIYLYLCGRITINQNHDDNERGETNVCEAGGQDRRAAQQRVAHVERRRCEFNEKWLRQGKC